MPAMASSFRRLPQGGGEVLFRKQQLFSKNLFFRPSISPSSSSSRALLSSESLLTSSASSPTAPSTVAAAPTPTLLLRFSPLARNSAANSTTSSSPAPFRLFSTHPSPSPRSAAAVSSAASTAMETAGATAQQLFSAATSALGGKQGKEGAFQLLNRLGGGGGLKTAAFSMGSGGSAAGSPCDAICRMLSSFRYRNLRKETVEKVIKVGTFARTMWPVLLPVILYQYIRQTDNELFSCELLYLHSQGAEPSTFYDASKAGWGGHWKLQQDLALIYYTANPKEAERAAEATKIKQQQ